MERQLKGPSDQAQNRGLKLGPRPETPDLGSGGPDPGSQGSGFT